MKTALRFLALAALLCLGYPVRADVVTSPLNFIAGPQSLWGSGGSASFGDSGGASLGPVSFSYDIGASTGSVSARFEGDLSVAYTPFLSTAGTTSVSLSFLGDAGGGQLKSDLGAWVNVQGCVVSFCVDILDEDYGLNIDKGFVPSIGQQASGSNSVTVGSLGVNLGLVQVGANFDLEQTDTFKATAIDGFLAYGRRGSGTSDLIPFSLATNAGLNLDVALTEGTWDFWVVDLDLDNEFKASFDALLILAERNRGCGFLGLEWCDWNYLPLADIDVYNGSPFALGFNTISDAATFSIGVGTASVPEPSTLALLGLGLAGVAASRRRGY